jgi:hypothetical protein
MTSQPRSAEHHVPSWLLVGVMATAAATLAGPGCRLTEPSRPWDRSRADARYGCGLAVRSNQEFAGRS